MVRLTQSTIEANRRFFASEAEVPREAVSLGVGSIMNARRVILIATGEDKAIAVRRAIREDIDPTTQASILRTHPHAGANGAYFAIANRENDLYLGQCDLISINWKMRSADMAIVMGDEQARGRGIGTEAIGLILAYAFTMLGLERVELEVATDNHRAMRCYQKAGFTLEGIKRHAFMVDGKFADLAVMAVLADEWRAAHPEAKLTAES